MGCFDNIDAFRESKRYLKKENTLGIRNVYSDLWKNYVNLYGVQTNYYRHGYNLDTQDDFLYGEDSTESFHVPKSLNIIAQYQTDAILLSKFGIESTADLNGIIVIKDFEDKFGINMEPKAGDIIEMTEAAWTTDEMNPDFTNIISYFNIITSNLNGYSIIDLSGIEVYSTKLAPVKEIVYENELSYFTPLYIPETAIQISGYPITQELVEVNGNLESFNYIRLNINEEIYFTPLYTPSVTITSPAINALYFQHDIVDLNGEDMTHSGYFPFDYQGQQLLMPVYQYSTSGTPASATVIISADPMEYYQLDAKQLICMYRDNGYVSSLLIPLSSVYGSRFIRYPQLYEITEVKYQDFSQQGVNFAQGHYVWIIHAKRFEYSFEPGIQSAGEIAIIDKNQVYDNSFTGIISATYAPSSDEKIYDQNATDAGDEVWDYETKGTDTGPYGYY